MNRGLRVTANAHASEVTYFTPKGLPLGAIDDIAVTNDGKDVFVVAVQNHLSSEDFQIV